jgi:hypothetical protein
VFKCKSGSELFLISDISLVDQTLIKEGTSVNVDNNIEPETIETREISEIKNNSEPDLHYTISFI